ncbi:MAG: hypothetical protein JW751_10220 [Polyangiaceae bacterium]|nr:hypothetical protein [Polyangiaceae bacterium]
METNRDLYCFIAELVKQRPECTGTLQSYLENLRRLCHNLRAREAVSPAEFAELLRAAFAPEPGASEAGPTATSGYVVWEKRIGEQIRDLDEMRRSGTLDNEYRYFGVDAPRGGRWYNFDPCTYLECAAAGTFGGWQDGDDTGRSYVPGPVAVLDASGAITSMGPRDIDDPVVALAQITWEMFVDFLDAGQWYE